MIFFGLLTLFGVQLIVVLVLRIGFGKAKHVSGSKSEKSFSILIPFHNETLRIDRLIDSLNELDPKSKSNHEFIFIDDHSTDSTRKIIEERLEMDFRIIKNPGAKGKKQAIKSGVEHAQFDWLITWDADVTIPPNYFESLPEPGSADMVVMPVRMEGSGLVGKLGAVEFEFLQLLTFGTGGFDQAVLSNGANLMIRKSAFIEAEEVRNDYEIASGDDMFLLDAFVELKKRIVYKQAQGIRIRTRSPKKVEALVQQRKRWLGKMKLLWNPVSLFGGIFLLLIQVGFVLSMYHTLFSAWFLLPVFIKIMAEWIAIRRLNAIFIVLIHQFWYPPYILLLLAPTRPERRWN